MQLINFISTEESRQDTLSYIRKQNRIIYLGIPTNILCIDDRLKFGVIEDDGKTPVIKPTAIATMDGVIEDFTATLYLGKIIFKKNKYSNLAPIYIPSNITESSFEGLNTFWLNELNPDAKKPFQSMIRCDPVSYDGPPELFSGEACEPDPKLLPYQKIYYYRSKDNIVLSKAQIISYFTELHRLNATFIKSYIDSINKHDGIRANYLNGELYEKLLKKGILKKDMFEWYSDGNWTSSNKANLITLDYLKKTNQYNFTIALFDELFYIYFLVSLKDFILAYDFTEATMQYIDDNNLIFNTGAYKKYYDMFISDKQSELHLYIQQRYIDLFLRWTNSSIDWYISGFDFESPNQTNDTTYDYSYQPPIYAPSPLGNYYFELDDNLGTFTEFYTRIYPSIKNPPKGWTKEMMSKLELTLE